MEERKEGHKEYVHTKLEKHRTSREGDIFSFAHLSNIFTAFQTAFISGREDVLTGPPVI